MNLSRTTIEARAKDYRERAQAARAACRRDASGAIDTVDFSNFNALTNKAVALEELLEGEPDG